MWERKEHWVLDEATDQSGFVHENLTMLSHAPRSPHLLVHIDSKLCYEPIIYIFSPNKKIGLIYINSPWPPQLHILKNWIEILKKKKKAKEKKRDFNVSWDTRIYVMSQI